MSDNSNNVHFSGVRFICSPYLAIKSALASLGPIMARCGPQMNFTPSNEHYCYIDTCLVNFHMTQGNQVHLFQQNERFIHKYDMFVDHHAHQVGSPVT